MISLLQGDCRAVLPSLPDASVHCVVTSPPYWGLRDYGVDGQLGLEPDFNAYVANMVAVFREVRRVLRDDGTLWLNLGDSYASGGRGGGADGSKQQTNFGSLLGAKIAPHGLKPKDLCGIPWRVAFALQADGWYLRQDIIWSKPNPMPESVTDRCTKAHEYLFLLSKCERYYYDAEAIREPHSEPERSGTPENRWSAKLNADEQMINGGFGRGKYTHRIYNPAGRNKRSVWEIATAPFSEAHFATFPPALIEPCIKAGTSEKGCCGQCGKPRVRQVERATSFQGGSGAAGRTAAEVNANGKWAGQQYGTNIKLGPVVSTTTTGWSPSCACAADPVPCTVLDPFSGAGTTGLVADRLQRNAILIELNPTYAAMGERRITGDAPLFAEVTDGTPTVGPPAELRSRLRRPPVGRMVGRRSTAGAADPLPPRAHSTGIDRSACD